jgi:hypothetical protein
MTLAREGWIGVGLLIVTPILFVIFYLLGVLTNIVSALEQITVFVLASMIIAGAALVYRGAQVSRRNVLQPVSKSVAKPSITPKPVTYEAICEPGPYDVGSGNPPVKVPLNVHEGEKVIGEVTEKEGYKFNCYIADSLNYVKLANKERGFSPIFKSESKGAHHVHVSIPNDRQWYAVLDAYGQQYVREVLLNLKRPSRR